MFEESQIALFVNNFNESDINRVAFAWNGKQAAEFIDTNLEFREEVTRYVLQHPAGVSVDLLRALFLAHAECSIEAGGAPLNFADLGALLLSYGGPDVVDDFATGFMATFDTYGACHGMSIDTLTLRNVIQYVAEALEGELDDEHRRYLEATQNLFEKIKAGTAQEGWKVISPGSEVHNIRVVKGKHLIGLRIKEAFRRLFTR